MSKTLLDKAWSNYNICEILLEQMSDDDEFLNIVGYHLQQSVELAIKFVLERNGIEYPKVHDIGQLIRLAENNQVCLGKIDYIDDHADMFSTWEAKTRYVLNDLVDYKRIQKAMPEVQSFLNSIKDERGVAATPKPSKICFW